MQPLTLEERIHTSGLIDHDLRNWLATMYSRVYISMTNNEPIAEDETAKSRIRALYVHLKCLLDAHTAMVSSNDCIIDKVDPLEMSKAFDTLAILYGPERIKPMFSVEASWTGNLAVRYLALSNLVKNSLRLCTGPVLVNATTFKGKLENMTYIPEGVATEGIYIRFDVCDDGPGFGPEPERFLTKGESTGGSGLGLYFVKLACKYLKDGLLIESKPGDTKVSMFHNIG